MPRLGPLDSENAISPPLRAQDVESPQVPPAIAILLRVDFENRRLLRGFTV